MVLIAYMVAILLVVGIVLLAKRARQQPSFLSYAVVLPPALVAVFYARLVEGIIGQSLGTDSIGAGITLVVILVGVGFSTWSLGYGLKTAFGK